LRRHSATLGLLAVVCLPVAAQDKYVGKSCSDASCHGSFTEEKVVHVPVSRGECDSCHEQTDAEAHRFRLIADGAELCYECHDEFEGERVHAPVASGQCGECHNPHASAAKHLLVKDSSGELCLECHEDAVADLPHTHGPVAAGACSSCHAAHAGDEAALLIAPARGLCLGCHKDVGESLEVEKVKHAPAADGCTDCHQAHGGNDRMMLVAEGAELCFACHDDIQEAVEDASVGHSVVTQGRGCVSCHHPHAAPRAGLLAKSCVEVCMGCHNQPVGGGDDRVAAIAHVLDAEAVRHGPINDGNCVACHTPHGGEQASLLLLAYPKRFYATFDEGRYALCFDCHDVEAFEEETTDEATAFRNGDRNLHFVHVNREVKGRTCRACHDVHASTRQHLIADRVPFGQWEIPVGFEPTATGGSCAGGCHQLYRYDRESPVVYAGAQ